MIFETSMLITRQIDSLSALGSHSSALADANAARHLHFLPIARIPILQYVVKLLIITYWVSRLGFGIAVRLVC